MVLVRVVMEVGVDLATIVGAEMVVVVVVVLGMVRAVVVVTAEVVGWRHRERWW